MVVDFSMTISISVFTMLESMELGRIIYYY